MKSLQDLINRDTPAWPEVQEWIRQAACSLEVLPAAEESRASTLVALQVTTRSVLGSVAFETGGLLIDHSWLRVLGSGHPRLPRTVPQWNTSAKTNGYCLVADDVIGGFFAMDGGALGLTPGEVGYFAPDTLKWEATGLQYSAFLHWCLSGKLTQYYQDHRWIGWEREIAPLGGDQVLAVVPFLWAKGPPIGQRIRKPVPIKEAWSLQQDFVKQLQSVPDGTDVIVRARKHSTTGNS